MTRRLYAAALVLGTLFACSLGRTHSRPPPMLGPTTEGLPKATVTRVAIDLSEMAGAVAFPTVRSRLPLEAFWYDSRFDRFLIPGFDAIDRAGTVTLDAHPLGGPPGAAFPDAAVLLQVWESEYRRGFSLDWLVVLAVWSQGESVVALVAEAMGSKANPHSRSAPDSVALIRLDPTTFRPIDAIGLPLDDGWNFRGTFDRFLRDGTLVVGLDTRPRHRWGRLAPSAPVPYTGGGRHAVVRIDPSGELSVVHRGRWRSAGLSPFDEVVGVAFRTDRSVLLGLDLDGKRKFRAVFPDVWLERAATHRDGVCTIGHVVHEELSRWVLSCFDRQLEPRWTRSVRDRVDDWLVDEDGWVYLGIPGPNVDAVVDGELVAVTPDGAIAWRLATTIGPDRIMLVGDDLCVIPDPTNYPEPAAQIVCVSPRHGRHDEPWGRPGPRSLVSVKE